MRDRLLLFLICASIPFTSTVVVAADDASGPTDTATLKITFTVPQRNQATARVTTNDYKTSSVCLTTRGSSAFAVNALIQEGVEWQFAPVNFRQDRSAPGLHDCDDDLSVRLDLNDSWYGANGMLTLLVSPL